MTVNTVARFSERKRLPPRSQGAAKPFPNDGVCDFPVDPTQPAGRTPVFWIPELSPDVIELRASLTDADDPAAMPINLAELTDLVARLDENDAWHGFWQPSTSAHQFWLPTRPVDGPATYVVIIPVDKLLELRAEAVLRLWRALVSRSEGRRAHDFPKQTQDRHILMLRAFDGRAAGVSYRKLAEVLLGFQGRKADWDSDPRKNQVRRLVADGRYYVRGGYRDLLHYPIRLLEC
ncbi:hypothetical protein ASN_2091 [Acetobacter senegalensis]|uniref:T6SS Transcription factor RovC-like DNA binding domain-containing protein n=1 Tax=Acetobacter senegalensis TaxID=446692 RepID=A0A0U5EVN6_9PROT|nr:DUF2285 domain-containing protein [Acetobacter senegalensis]CEF41396.1 hypothetical protein ASN_2091 [Acetobacter senegalensis]